MAKKSTVTLTINAASLKKRFGDTVKIEVDENNTPLDRYWRSRVRDSKIDNCVSLPEVKTTSTKTAKNGGDE